MIRNWGSRDPKDQDWSPYQYCGANPVMMIDPNGENWLGAVIGGPIGAYVFGSLANGSWNPGKWDWDDLNTYSAIIGGASMGMSLGSGIENEIINSRHYNGQIRSAYGHTAARKLTLNGSYDSWMASRGIESYTLADAYIVNRHNAVYGAGHQGIVVGNDRLGYYYFSKDAKVGLGSNTALEFDSFNDFLGATQACLLMIVIALHIAS